MCFGPGGKMFPPGHFCGIMEAEGMYMVKNARFMNILAAACLCAVIILAGVAAFMPRQKLSIPPSPEVTPIPADRVYVTPSGAKYHRRSCSTIANSEDIIGYSPIVARRNGYSPCLKCEP